MADILVFAGGLCLSPVDDPSDSIAQLVNLPTRFRILIRGPTDPPLETIIRCCHEQASLANERITKSIKDRHSRKDIVSQTGSQDGPRVALHKTLAKDVLISVIVAKGPTVTPLEVDSAAIIVAEDASVNIKNVIFFCCSLEEPSRVSAIPKSTEILVTYPPPFELKGHKNPRALWNIIHDYKPLAVVSAGDFDASSSRAWDNELTLFVNATSAVGSKLSSLRRGFVVFDFHPKRWIELEGGLKIPSGVGDSADHGAASSRALISKLQRQRRVSDDDAALVVRKLNELE